MTIQPVAARSVEDFEPAFDKIAADRLEGVAVPADGLFYQGRARIAQAALQRRLPLMTFSRETSASGRADVLWGRTSV